MENRTYDTPEKLRDFIFYLQYSKHTEEAERMALKCIRKAQEFKDTKLEFEARSAYISITVFLEKYDLAMAMFPWLLKKCDEDREAYSYRGTLWSYKWMMSGVKKFTTIPLTTIDGLLADLEQRFRDYSNSERAISFQKYCYYSETGQLERAEEAYRAYLEQPKCTLEDCSACQPNSIAEYWLNDGRYEEMLELVDPILKKNLSCQTVPENTYHRVFLANLLLGRYTEAEYYAARSRKIVTNSTTTLAPFASHLIWHGIKGEFGKGRSVFEQQFPRTFRHLSDLSKLQFFTGAQLFFRYLSASGRKTIRLNLPENPFLFRENPVYKIDEVLQFLSEQCTALSAAFDRRNGNDYYTRLLATDLQRYGNIRLEQQ